MRRLLAGTLFWLALATQAAGPQVAQKDARAIRAVIAAQLDALSKNDGAKAFSYASPGIRAQFGIPEVFMAMVREGYTAMLEPLTARFQPPVVEAGQTIQPVQLIDEAGRIWAARYVMERQKDGSWRVGGCSLARAAGTAT